MALVSPGLQLTVTDESQYVSASVGSVPLIVLATSENKTANGILATGTTKANAGKLQAFTSQRELVSSLGYPVFQQSSAGTPLHGNALNEYGLMAAYSTLSLGNRVYAIRADIDLNQLEATSVRPIGDPDNGTFWLDLANTSWGIHEWSASTGTFTEKTPLLITDSDDTVLTGDAYVPKTSIGQVNTYAVVVAADPTAAGLARNRVYYKTYGNQWAHVGSDLWKGSIPTVTSKVAPVIGDAVGGVYGSLVINGQPISITTGNTAEDVVNAINAVGSTLLPGVTATVITNNAANAGKIGFFVNSLAASDGETADGIMTIQDGDVPVLDYLEIAEGSYYSPSLVLSSYVNAPSWRDTDDEPRPSGSVWIKTTAIGNGINLSVKKYIEDTDSWTRLAAPIYEFEDDALLDLDPAGGGFGLSVDTVIGLTSVFNSTLGGVRLHRRKATGVTSHTGDVVSGSFTVGHQIRILATQPGGESIAKIVTLNGTTVESFVSDILGRLIPNVTVQLTSDNRVTFIHDTGGTIRLFPINSTPALTTAGFNSTNTPYNSQAFVLSNWEPLTYTYSLNQPYQSPADGTLWYYGSATDVDVMINDNGWKGYQNVSSDARGYDLSATDPNGVIVSASRPTTQSDNTGLVAGDLWLDTSDLENFPKLYRYTAAGTWSAIDNTDRVSQNGIVFADARWDSTGETDIIAGNMPSISAMLESNYTDLDCPDYRLYPRGTLLFNTRRSGFNVKQYVGNYFNAESFPNDTLPDVSAAWVTASGLKDSGAPYMGSEAQRNMVIKALRSALDGNSQVREDQYAFNLIATPGYPELIANMVALNNDRANTAFVIGDTPMTLAANSVTIKEWSSNTNGDGLTTADPYLGVFYPAGLTNDVQGNTIAVPASHMALRTFIRSDNVSYPWFAPAGVRRGLVDNATDIGYVNATTGGFITTGINQGLRDSLYETRINPFTVLPGVGLVNWGQKTRNGMASAMDRINVARLVNYIRTILATVGNGFLFEPNDKITRDQIKQIIEGAMNDLVAKRGIYDYVVVCDTSNNTPDRIARNELYVDIAIEPMKDVEFIYIPIRLKNPGDISGSVA